MRAMKDKPHPEIRPIRILTFNLNAFSLFSAELVIIKEENACVQKRKNEKYIAVDSAVRVEA
ncbi:hypothetical protein [Scopulibacillus darangshiensis]|nr:hypothetical protein [Scopulibacillus darangshiensis]